MDERRALADAVRELCRRNGGYDALTSAITREGRYDDALWQALAGQIGAAGLAISEEFDGAGASLAETAAVLEVLGETLAPVPLFSSALAAYVLTESGDTAACARLLPDLATGKKTATLCWAGRSGWSAPGVQAEAGLLHGTSEYVIDGESADTFVVFAGPGPHGAGSGTLHVVDADAPGITVTPCPVLDATRPLARVTFDQVAAESVPAPRTLPDTARAAAWALLAAEQTGAATRALELTVEHTGARTQFGRTLASFQALKHAMADMYVLVETMRSVSTAAVAAVAAGASNAGELAAAAHVYCSDGLVTVSGQAIQLHGGIGITAEHPIGRYFKRGQADAQLFGNPSAALARIAL